MKKFWLTLGLTLMLTGWGPQGFYGLGTRTGFAQSVYPPPYYNPNYCPQPYNYCNYYSAPYQDPLSQFLYYLAPQIGGEEEEQEEREHREYYEHRGHEGEGFQRREHGREGYEHRGH